MRGGEGSSMTGGPIMQLRSSDNQQIKPFVPGSGSSQRLVGRKSSHNITMSMGGLGSGPVGRNNKSGNADFNAKAAPLAGGSASAGVGGPRLGKGNQAQRMLNNERLVGWSSLAFQRLRRRRGPLLAMAADGAAVETAPEVSSEKSQQEILAQEAAEEDDPFIKELKEECVQEEQAAQKEKENYWEEQLNNVEQGIAEEPAAEQATHEVPAATEMAA